MSGKSPEGENGIFKGSSLDWHSDRVHADVSFLGRVLTRYDHIPTYAELVERISTSYDGASGERYGGTDRHCRRS